MTDSKDKRREWTEDANPTRTEKKGWDLGFAFKNRIQTLRYAKTKNHQRFFPKLLFTFSFLPPTTPTHPQRFPPPSPLTSIQFIPLFASSTGKTSRAYSSILRHPGHSTRASSGASMSGPKYGALCVPNRSSMPSSCARYPAGIGTETSMVLVWM